MKAIDTNMLVRFLVADDPAQARSVRHLFEEAERNGDRLLIPLATVLETIWVLESSYECPRSVIFDLLDKLTRLPILQFEAADRIKDLASLGSHAKLDPADLLIALSARDLGCETTLTFDRKTAKSSLFEYLR